jgi:glycosyltransferase involved in cell wall biosynthesis
MMRVEPGQGGERFVAPVAPVAPGGTTLDREVAHPSLTVVMPAYNEEGAIEAAVDDVRAHVLDIVGGSLLLVVNDGSRDRTGAILDAIAARDPRVRVLHQPNGGHGAALMAGLSRATTDYVFLLDSDRQIPLDDFPSAWALACGGRDAVFGVRRHRDDPAIRLALTAVVRRAVRLMFGVAIHDANVPYKLVRRAAWERASAIIPPGTLAPSLFLAAYMKARGLDVAELEVAHRERQTGVVSIRRWKLLRFCARAFRQLVRFRMELGRG